MRLQLLLILLLAYGTQAQNWQKLSPDNECTKRHENSFVAVGNQLLAVGGRGVKPVESYDPATNKWTKLIESPIEMHHFQAIAYNNELWVLGAFTGGYPHEKPIENIYIFNPERNKWRMGPFIPADRRRGAAACFVHNDKIYLLCGITDGHWDGHVAWFDEYDPRANAWRKLPDAPRVRDHISGAVIDKKVYLAGGRKSHAAINQVLNLTTAEVDVFDFKKNTWSTLPAHLNIPTQRAGASSIVWNKKLVVIGGESAAQVPAHAEAEVYDPKKKQWSKLPNLQQGRHGTGATVFNKKIYVSAGSANRGGGPELNDIEVY